ncbi:MAG: 50S ribosomal protein L11 methyltransferase [Ignavibacteriae bacterium]|nr:50S ribosomal protein L11 methyltransferase [Ignavibacteria bacterium]MBI3364975.1 50S ribosomal protein L11 methyltransferase [Ignavibacteriota bacterium]
MKTYLEISISAGEQQREMLIPTMLKVGCEGFQETDTSLLCYLTMDRWDHSKLQSLKHDLRALLRTISSNAEVVFREIQDQNWNEQWEKTIRPIEVSNRIVIKPSWAEYNNLNGKIVIQIDPKMSFGTGYHETTRLTLQLLEEYLQPGWAVLDVGTGTGVLAIAAIKLGASSAIGTDIDEWALENAKENVEANAVQGTVEIVDKPASEFPYSHFDLISANLTLNTNIEMLDDFRNVLRDGGMLLLSGLLRGDRGSMVNELGRKHFEIVGERFENEWVAIAAKKR